MTRRKLFQSVAAAVAAPAIPAPELPAAGLNLAAPRQMQSMVAMAKRWLVPMSMRNMIEGALVAAGLIFYDRATEDELLWGYLHLRDLDIRWAGLDYDHVRWLSYSDLRGQEFALASVFLRDHLTSLPGPKFKPAL